MSTVRNLPSRSEHPPWASWAEAIKLPIPSRYEAISCCPGCLPALCGRSRMQAMMMAAMTAEAIGRLKASPP